MTTPNRIVFEATGKPPEVGDYAMDTDGSLVHVIESDEFEMWVACPAYRRIDAPADSWLLEVATAIYAARIVKGSRSVALDGTNLEIAESIASARALIAACEGAATRQLETNQ